MMEIKICIGSACHLKGSYQVINSLKNLVIENGLENKIELKSDFCLGQCGEGVSLKINDEPVSSICVDQIDDFFYKKIYKEVTE